MLLVVVKFLVIDAAVVFVANDGGRFIEIAARIEKLLDARKSHVVVVAENV